jgi:hypothetical protein
METTRMKWGMTMVEFKEYLGENVVVQVLELMDAIKKKNPMLQFKVGSNRLYINDPNGANGRVEIKTSLIAFDVGDPDKAIGGIGFDSDDKYFVRSRLIRNEKFGRWNSAQHQSKSSKHMKNIVKEALKALKPLSYEEVKEETDGNVSRAINDMRGKVQRKAYSHMKLEFADVFPELLHMHNTGYTPATPKMAQSITWAVANKEELEKYYNYEPKKCMIWVRPNSVVYEIDKVVTQVNSTSELPEELRGKLFVLDVTDKGQFVEDVGMRQDTGIYWVLLEEK